MTTKRSKLRSILTTTFCLISVSAVLLSFTACTNDSMKFEFGKTSSQTESEKSVTEAEKSNPNGQPSIKTEMVTDSSDDDKDDSKNNDEINDYEISAAAKYYLADSDEKLVECYKKLSYGFLNYDESISIPKGVIYKDDLSDFITLVLSTTPQINHIDSEYGIVMDSNSYVTKVNPTYKKTSEQTKSEISQLNSEISSIISQAEGLSDYEKVKYFHDKIIMKCTYSEQNDNAYSAYGCLIEGSAVCEGYSKAMLMLCEQVEIPCVPVIGKSVSNGENIPHMWNKVKIDDSWYNVDVTWDDPIGDLGDDYIRYDYLNITDNECSNDHTFEESKYLKYPVADTNECNYYVKSGLFIENADEIDSILTDAIVDSVYNGDRHVRIKCSSKELFDYVNDEYFDNSSSNSKLFEILSNASEQTDGAVATNSYGLTNNDKTLTFTIILNWN